MGRTLAIGHRGAAGEAPENTLTAIEVALAADVDAIEVDLRLSRDGAAIVLHDATLDRTTNAIGRVSELYLDEIRRANIPPAEHIPTLDEVLERVAGLCDVFCEIKTDTPGPTSNERLVVATIEAIQRHRAEPWTAVHSFDPTVVGMARAACPSVCAAVISPGVPIEHTDQLFETALRVNAQAISIQHSAVDEQLVVAAHRRHLTVWAWTADEAAEWDRLVAVGADGIITNLPSTLRAYLLAG